MAGNPGPPISSIHEPGLDAAFWLLFGQACTNLTREDVAKRLAREPCGTRLGWQLDEGKPVACSERPGYWHYTVRC